MKRFLFPFYFLVPVVCFGPLFLARGNVISVSGGIAHPSFNSAVDQNPAGYVFNTKTKVSAEALIPEDGDAVPGGIGLIGNGEFGAALGIRHHPETDDNVAHYGIAVLAPGLKLALGISGASNVDEKQHDFNLGILAGIGSEISFGAVIYSLEEGPGGYGAGIEYSLSERASFIVDAASGKEVDSVRIKPGLLVKADKACLSVSYGIDTDKEKAWGGAITDKFSAAGSYLVTDSILVQAYYRQISHVYMSATFMF